MRLKRPSWADYLQLGTEEIRHYGRDSIQVARRLRVMLEDLATVTSGSRREAVARELQLLEAISPSGSPKPHGGEATASRTG